MMGQGEKVHNDMTGRLEACALRVSTLFPVGTVNYVDYDGDGDGDGDSDDDGDGDGDGDEDHDYDDDDDDDDDDS